MKCPFLLHQFFKISFQQIFLFLYVILKLRIFSIIYNIIFLTFTYINTFFYDSANRSKSDISYVLT